MGFVECIELETGKSRWLYSCPSVLIQMSGGSYYGIPMNIRAKRHYRRNNGKENTPGTFLLPKDTDPSEYTRNALMKMAKEKPTKVIVDLHPVNPYPELDSFLLFCRIVAICFLVLLVAVHRIVKFKKLPRWTAVLCAVFLTAASGVALNFLGWVGGLAIPASILILMSYIIWGLVAYYREKKWIPVIVLLFSAGGVVYWLFDSTSFSYLIGCWTEEMILSFFFPGKSFLF
ncbi:MAG: hypothetical protein GY795_21120 [Desulfobacterales bacterium]|nr:hypothetical protein [Desulfobacterales bacterium]